MCVQAPVGASIIFYVHKLFSPTRQRDSAAKIVVQLFDAIAMDEERTHCSCQHSLSTHKPEPEKNPLRARHKLDANHRTLTHKPPRTNRSFSRKLKKKFKTPICRLQKNNPDILNK
jgi:hypothetical protein